VKVAQFHQHGPVGLVVLTVLTGVGQWTRGLVFRCVLRLESFVCVLVPMSSGTPVATWAWPTWVVSRRRVLEAVFNLGSESKTCVGQLVFISFEKNFLLGFASSPI
jgi:hypothetical protein